MAGANRAAASRGPKWEGRLARGVQNRGGPENARSLMNASVAHTATGQSRVQTLFASFTQLLRSYQLYGPNGAPNARLLGNVRAQFEAIWTLLPELEIAVTDRTLRLGEDTVYESDPTSESLPFCLYRDSIRTLTFLPGFETYELESFIEVLHTARQRSESDDLLTTLWERDFGYLRYAYVDLSANDAEDAAGGPGAAEDANPNVARAVAAHMGRTGTGDALTIVDLDGDLDGAAALLGGAAAPAGAGTSAGMDPDSLPQQIAANARRRDLGLAPEDLAYLRAELELEMQRDVVLDVVNALLDCIEEPIPRLQSQALRNLEQLLPQLVVQQRLHTAGWALDEIARLAESTDAAVTPLRGELRRIVSEFTAAMLQGEVFVKLKESAESQPEVLSGVLAHAGGDALEPLVRWAAQARGATREVVRRAAGACAAGSPGAIVALLRDQDPVICRAALDLCVQNQDPRFVPHLSALLQHGDTGVRVAAVQALTTLGGAPALAALVAALDQPVSDVRTAVAWGLGVWAHEPAAERLLQLLGSKALPAAPLPEKIAMFDAYARVRGPEAVEWLAGVLKSRFRLGRRPTPEIRACAARALGSLGTEAARTALQAARDDKEPAVRTAVQRALERCK